MTLLTDACGSVFALDWTDCADTMERRLRSQHRAAEIVIAEEAAAASEARGRLEAYFSGDLRDFACLQTCTGGTPFQGIVWAALKTIPVGHTLSYAELASRIGKPQAVRAVGSANGSNVISIIVPCHRVIGSNGDLRGYGGGLERKRWLLQHEAPAAPRP